jgi:hypothetical protein
MPRYSDETLRGMLLEEAILYILSKTGYSPIFEKNGDSSLNDGSAGLEIYGRGAKHQIDAVADFRYTPPFCNRQRLLIEAKFRESKTGIEVVRNAAGVHKDVSEYWVVDSISGRRVASKRFHYLYAIFSKEEFSKPAQDYAYAQDIFLLPLKNNSLFRPIISAIDNLTFEGIEDKPKLSVVRRYVRKRLFSDSMQLDLDDGGELNDSGELLFSFVDVCRNRGSGFLTMFDGNFPVFLSASRGMESFVFQEENYVRIRVGDLGWSIETRGGEELFTFDLPEEIFDKYQRSGSLSRRQLLNIKDTHMSSFYVFVSQGDDLKLVSFKLDRNWFRQVSQNLGN